MKDKMISYRPCRRSDAAAIAEICFKTGYMGEDAAGHFHDVKLFGYLFGLYYVLFEPENGFVAEDSGQVVGYVVGTPDAAGLPRRFNRQMLWRVVLRLIFYTAWRYPGDLLEVLYWNHHNDEVNSAPPSGYPAHLHINILPGYQRLGIGAELISLFTDNLKDHGINGVYLETSNHNVKAIPFYKKLGFDILDEREQTHWRGVEGHKTVVFGKKLEEI